MKLKTIILLLTLSICLCNAQTVKFMTYNIRYDNPRDMENRWELRKEFLTDQVKFFEPDIMGIQEGLHHQVKYIDNSLGKYDYTGVGRDDGKTKGEYSAIFYKSQKYNVHKSFTFWLSETPQKVSVGWDASMERICTCTLFEEIKSKQKFWVFNTHFDHIGDLARLNSAKLIIKKIDELNNQKFPVILMGDLNLKPESEAIKYITNHMNDSYLAASHSFGPDITFNGFNYNFTDSKRIDYIFTSKTGIEVLKYAVLTDSKNQKFPSDHFPVIIEIVLK